MHPVTPRECPTCFRTQWEVGLTSPGRPGRFLNPQQVTGAPTGLPLPPAWVCRALLGLPRQKQEWCCQKRLWDHWCGGAQSPTGLISRETHTHMPMHGSYSRDRSAGHRQSHPRVGRSRHSTSHGWALSDVRGKVTTVTITGKQLSGWLERKCLAQHLPRIAAVSKMQGGTAALCARRVSPQPQLGCGTTPLQN